MRRRGAIGAVGVLTVALAGWMAPPAVATPTVVATAGEVRRPDPGTQYLPRYPCCSAWASALPGSVGVNGDGRLEVLAPSPDGTVHTIFQHEIGLGWSTPAPFTHPPGSRTTRPVSVVTDRDERLVAAWVGEDGQAYVTRQRAGRDGWIAIAPVDPSGPHLAAPPVFARNEDDRLELFTVATNGDLVHAYEHVPGGVWSEWSVLDAGQRYSTDPEGAVSTTISTYDPGIVLTAVREDGRLAAAVQDLYLTGDPLWTPFADLEVDGVGRPHSIDGSHVCCLEPLTVFRTAEGRLLSIDPHRAVVPITDGPVAHGPVFGRNQDGRKEIFVAGADGMLHHAFQPRAPGAPLDLWFGEVVPMGMPCAQSPSVAPNADGRLEVFCTGPDGTLWHDFQAVPNGGWFGRTALEGTYATGL